MTQRTYRRPESVLVVIYTTDDQVLLMRRCVPPDFWQSVTGSLEWQEQPRQAAERELFEETGLLGPERLLDSGVSRRFDIWPQWRHRYQPGVCENLEHCFYFCLPAITEIRLNPEEHSEYVWLRRQDAVQRAASWTNQAAILALP